MDDATSQPPHPKEQPTTASALLSDLVEAFPEERVTVGDILHRLEGQAFGLLLLLLALPNCIPNIPGLSTIFGVLMIAPAVQLIFGQEDLWLPRRVRRWSISRDALHMAIKGSLPVLKRIERYVGPRWTFLTHPPFTQLLGLQTLAMALVLILPIPLGNWPPGMTVAATAIALLQRDGRLALLSVPMAVVSLFVAALGGWAGLKVLAEIGEGIHSLIVWIF